MAEVAGKEVLPAEIEAISELKKELHRTVEALVEEDEDDCDLEVADNAIRTLCALKDLKLKQSDKEYVKLGSSLGFQEPPPEFRCPISGILMKDPVVVASGQTYDEQYIQRRLKDGNYSCPQTDQVLPHTALIPNCSVKKMIVDWCKVHHVDMPRTSDITNEEEEEFTGNVNDEEHLMGLIGRLFCSISEQKDSVRSIRLLTHKFPSFRALFGVIIGAIPLLMQSINSSCDLREDLLATILNISADETVRNKVVADCGPSIVSFLIGSMTDGRTEMKCLAAAALCTLSMVDSNKRVIGELGAIRSLIQVLEEGNLLVLKDAALAIHNICTVIQNSESAITEGAVITVVEKIKRRILIDEMLSILAMLSRHQKAIEEMDELGMLQCLFDILKESTTSEWNKEHCIAIIYAMCRSDRRILRKIDRIEDSYVTLSQLCKTGTPRAKRKATALLKRVGRSLFYSRSA